MPLVTTRQEIAIRFAEVQSFLTSIKNIYQNAQPESQELNTRKGLFLVLLYSVLEYSVSRAFIQYASTVNAARLPYHHVNDCLYALILDPQLTSCASVKKDNRWQKRIDLFKKQISNDIVEFSEGAFISQLENIWAKTIIKTFSVLGIEEPPLHNIQVSQYIDEVVERRNSVAHGRESAAVVGQAYTMGRLQKLNDEISLQVQYMIVIIEQNLDQKHFAKLQYRSLY